jgi:putative CocE/NonD family hydrolase
MIGPWNHSPLTGKPGDVDFGPTPRGNMVYTTSPLQEALEVTGPISAEIRASSSSVDTGLTAKLGDVWPSGYAQNLTDGIVRARYRDSFEKPEFMNPGQIYRFSIDLWATGNVFLPGHRLRLEISSSNFPRSNRNLIQERICFGRPE